MLIASYRFCGDCFAASQLGARVEAVTSCVKCDSWQNHRLLPGLSCEYKPPRPVTCNSRTTANCMIATDYAANGQLIKKWEEDSA